MENKIDSELKILWFSDIHYSELYRTKTIELTDFLNSFIEKCKEFKDIDYILISGDIAQSGKSTEYKLFNSDILEPLINLPNLSNSKILCVPGNHDLSRDEQTFLNQFISELSSGNFSRKDFLNKYNDKFKLSFKNYSNYLLRYLNKFPVELSDTYKNDFFHGFSIDHKKKTIFILLNSSWYSFGNEFLKNYVEKFLKFHNIKIYTKLKKKKFIETLEKISEEYGSQMVNYEVFNNLDNLFMGLENYSDYIVIKIMHHPINWLVWDERVNYNEKRDNTFFKVKNKTDLLLTGHEHVPLHHKPDFYNGDELLHIPAGCFIEHPKRGKSFKSENKSNWFSILTLNINKRNVLQEKYFYDDSKKKWETNSELAKNTIQLNKKYNTQLSKDRNNQILDRINVESKAGNLLNKLLNKTLTPYGDYYIDNENKSLFILVDGNYDVFNKIIQNKSLILRDNIDLIKFIFIDLFFQKKGDYTKPSKSEDKVEILENIKRNIDFEFDNFRHRFFSSIEENELASYCNLKFICVIFPYWEIEGKLI